MKSLVIDTSTEFALLAVVNDNEIIEQVRLTGGPALSKVLGLEIQKIIRDQKFDRVVVGVGPGSFTGIRVGVAMAQALAYGWGIELHTVSSLTGYALEEGLFAVAVDARSGGIYIQAGYESPTLMSRVEAPIFLSKFPIITSPHPDKFPTIQGIIQTQPNALLLSKHAIYSESPNLSYLSSLEEKSPIS